MIAHFIMSFERETWVCICLTIFVVLLLAAVYLLNRLFPLPIETDEEWNDRQW